MHAQLTMLRASGNSDTVTVQLDHTRTKPRDGSEGEERFRFGGLIADGDRLETVTFTDGDDPSDDPLPGGSNVRVWTSQQSVTSGRFSFDDRIWRGRVTSGGYGPKLDIEVTPAKAAGVGRRSNRLTI